MESKKSSLKTGKKENRTGKNRNTSGRSQYSTSSGTENFAENSNQDSLQKVFENLLKDIYGVELELIDTLPKVMEATYEEDLEDAIRDHLEETKRHAKRLEKIFDQLNISKDDAEISEPVSGLIGETTKIINEFESSPVRDSALIIVVQKIEHYEIATYGSLRTLADVMHMEQVGDVLDRTLEEEKAADELLSELSEDINEIAFDFSHSEYENMSSGEIKNNF